MSNCKYNPLGGVPKDGNFPIALSSRNISACSTRSNTVEANDLIVNDNLTVNGDLTATNVIATNDVTAGNDVTATGDVTGTNLIATNNVTAGNDVLATGDVTGTNLIATNNVTAGNDVLATGNVEATTVLVQPNGAYPQYDLPIVSGATVNFLAYGADNTGVTDQSALLTTVMGVGNRNIFFPPGTYRFNSPITMQQNVRLFGEHYGNTSFEFYDDTAGTRMFTIFPNDNVIENLYIRYYGAATDSVIFYGNATRRAIIRRIQTDATDVFGTFANFDANSQVLVSDNFINSTETCILAQDTSVVVVMGNVFPSSNTTPAIETTDTARVQVLANDFRRPATNLFVLAVAGSHFTNNYIVGATNIYTGPGAPAANILSDSATELSNFPNGLGVNGTQVLSTQRPGWTAPTNTVSRATFDTATVTLQELAQRVAALINDLGATTGHGLINA